MRYADRISSLCPPSRLAVLALGALAAGLSPSALAETPPPPPARGEAPVTTLSLLYHQRETCDTISGEVIGYWRDLAGDPSAQEATVRDFVLERQISDLAASRAAADLVERFMPRAQQEATSSETASSLRRLAGLARELCDAVALPTGPLDRFEAKIRDLLDRIEVEQKELGRLLVVPEDARVEAALQPYLGYIQIRGLQAQAEYLVYLESIREVPTGPTMTQRMQEWSRDVYSPAVAPAKRAFAAYLEARKARDASAMLQTCRQLTSPVIRLLRDDATFSPPDPRVAEPIRAIYEAMRGLGPHCTTGREQEVQEQLATIQKRLREASQALERYGIRP